MKILLVEDNADHRALMTHALTVHDPTWQVQGVGTGEEALHHLAEERFDLVCLDYSLPGWDGLEVLQAMQPGQGPPVVVVTGRGDEQVAVDALRAGAYDYVVKQDDYLQRLPVVVWHAVEAHQSALERQRAEEALRESEERFRQLAETTSTGILVFQGERFIYVNRACEKITGYAKDALLAMQFWDVIHPDFQELVHQRGLARQRGDTVPSQYEIKIVCQDGSERWIDYTAGSITWGGRPAIIGTAVDVTERKRTEKELRQSEERFAKAFHASPDSVAITRLSDNCCVDVNAGFERLTGYRRDEIIGRTALEMGLWAQPADRARYYAMLHVQGQVKDFETTFRTRSDALYTTTVSAEIIELHGVPHVLAIVHDITERKQAEVRLTRYATQLSSLATAMQQLHAAHSLDELLQLVTNQAREIVGAHQSLSSLITNLNWAEAINVTSLSDKYAAWRNYAEVPDGAGIYRLVCAQNCPLRLTQTELEAHPAWRRFGQPADQRPPLRGWLAVPLVGHDSENLGLIHLSDKYEGDFTPDDEAILTQLAQGASIAIENLRLFAEVHAGRAQLQRLSGQLIAAQESERRHIARELHDELGQALTSININLHIAQGVCGAAARPHLEEASATMAQVFQQVRGMSLDLRPTMLDDLGLIAALQWYVQREAQRSGFVVHLHTSLLTPRLPAELETACFRVAQAALTNVARHARARQAWVTLQHDAEGVYLTLRDDGIGFDVNAIKPRLTQGASFGLLGMRERIELLGGQFVITSTPGQGTIIQAHFPLSQAAEDGLAM